MRLTGVGLGEWTKVGRGGVRWKNNYFAVLAGSTPKTNTVEMVCHLLEA